MNDKRHAGDMGNIEADEIAMHISIILTRL